MLYWTGIGSRNAPDLIQRYMTAIARVFTETDEWVFRSGAAEGCDHAFELGVEKPHLREIYLPWPGFENHFDKPELGYLVPHKQFSNYSNAETIAEKIHPVWERLTQGAKKLHARNVYQVLGQDLETPSELLICWALPVGEKKVKGGTGTAVALAHENTVPVFNLYFEEDAKKLLEYAELLGVKLPPIPEGLYDDVA